MAVVQQHPVQCTLCQQFTVQCPVHSILCIMSTVHCAAVAGSSCAQITVHQSNSAAVHQKPVDQVHSSLCTSQTVVQCTRSHRPQFTAWRYGGGRCSYCTTSVHHVCTLCTTLKAWHQVKAWVNYRKLNLEKKKKIIAQNS